jgi:hypothetical protein
MRVLRIACVILAGLFVLAVLAAWQAPRFLDWDRYRTTIAGLAAAGLGRPVRIGGPVSLSLLPHPVLTAAGVTVADAGDGASADVPEMRLQVALGPLLAGRVEVRDLVLHGARMRLPWPPRAGALQQRPPAWLTGLHARIEDGTLLVGGLTVSDVAGELSADPLTGTLSMDGMAAALGRQWRVTARLGRAGGDGSAPLEASLDGLGAMQDTGGTLSGQIAADGSLTGRVSGRGRDLSQLIAAPASPWHAAGRFYGADGLALADELDVDIGGVPARGAVALRLLPAARVDAALAASRLDLDAWLPRLLQGGGTTLPTSVDLSAEAANFAGGTLRRLRAGFELSPDGVTVRDAEALLPGDAALTLSGRMTHGHFVGDAHIEAPALRDTLRWLQPRAPGLVDALPPGVLQAASLVASVTGDGNTLTLGALNGTVDGIPAKGDLTVRLGDHPALTATLALAGLALDPWLPAALPAGLPDLAAALRAWPGRWGDFDAALAVKVTRPRWHGAVLDALDLDAALLGGTLTLRHATVTGPDFTLAAHGSLAPGGHILDGRAEIKLAHAALLGAYAPPEWPTGLFRGPANLELGASGEPAALGVSLRAGLADVEAEANGTADLVKQSWAGSVALRHPGAPRLLETLGEPGTASWLGDGSLSLAGHLAVDPERLELTGLDLSAGALRTTADLVLDRHGVPSLTGRLDAENLPLPLPTLRSPEPLALGALRGWRAQVAVSAAHVLLGLSPGLDHAAAAVALEDGALQVTHVTADLAGGRLTGQFAVDAAAPPHVSVQGAVAGAEIGSPLLDGPFDLTAGRVDGTAALTATGFSPAALLATLDGEVHATVQDGTVTGLDLSAVTAAFGQPDSAAIQPAVVHALEGGTTGFSRLDAVVTARRGAVAVQHATLTAPGGTVALTGTLDLPIDAADLRLAVTPAVPGAPVVGLRLIGPGAAPRRTPELADLARWLLAPPKAP